jgi:hypothetical protein
MTKMLQMHSRKDKQFYIEKNLRNLHNLRETIQKILPFIMLFQILSE